MRAFLAIAGRSFQQVITYRLDAWLGLVASFCGTATFVALWFTVLRGDAEGLRTVLAYVLASRLLREMHAFEVMSTLHRSIRTGSVSIELLKPMPYPVRLAAESVGRAGWSALRALPAYLLFGLGLDVTVPSPATFGLFLISAALGWIIALLIETAAASIIFFVMDVEGIHNMLDFFGMALGGALVPLWLMPEWAAAVARALPFQAALYTPGAIFAGRLAGAEALTAMTTQLFWVGALVLGLAVIWGRAVRKLVVQGG